MSMLPLSWPFAVLLANNGSPPNRSTRFASTAQSVSPWLAPRLTDKPARGEVGRPLDWCALSGRKRTRTQQSVRCYRVPDATSMRVSPSLGIGRDSPRRNANSISSHWLPGVRVLIQVNCSRYLSQSESTLSTNKSHIMLFLLPDCGLKS